MTEYKGQPPVREGEKGGVKYKDFTDYEGYVRWWDWKHPMSHKGKLYYGVSLDKIQDMRFSGVSKFILLGSEFYVPDERALRLMKKDGDYKEQVYKYENNPLKLYLFKADEKNSPISQYSQNQTQPENLSDVSDGKL